MGYETSRFFFEDMRSGSPYGQLELSPGNGYVVQGYDPGIPRPRSVTNPRPNADGVIDTTTWMGERTVRIDVALAPELCTTPTVEETLRDNLLKWLVPSLRPALRVASTDLTRDRFHVVRGESAATPRLYTDIEFGMVSMSFITDAVTYGSTLHSTNITGVSSITNAGNAPINPVILIYDCMGGLIHNQATNFSMYLPNYDITGTDFVEIDVANRTVLLNGDPAQSVYQAVAWPSSSWLYLEPGVQNVSFSALGRQGTGAKATLRWRDGWL